MKTPTLSPGENQSRIPRAAGFTLVELLVVLAALSILSMLLSPVISSVVPGFRLDRIADDVTSELRSARARAIATHQPVSVFIDRAGRSYWRSGGHRAASFPAGVDAEFVAARSLMPNEDVGQIRFFPDGTSSGGRLTLFLSGKRIVVLVDWFDGKVQRDD